MRRFPKTCMTARMQPAPHQAPPPKRSGFPVWLIVVMVVAVLGVLSVGILAALGIYGTRRYVQSAKTAEAKATVATIARGARAAFEQERAEANRHVLCATATDVPAAVPKGTKYMPRSGANLDFETGDEKTGWRCLRFSMTQPIYYQYSYRANGGYTVPAAQAPSGSGFEASAHGDLDGDGTQSLFALTGAVQGEDLVVSPQIFIDDELE